MFAFIQAPVETLRSSISARFCYALYLTGVRRSLEFVGLEGEDSPEGGLVRSHFTLGSELIEVVWTREHGEWRIFSATVPVLVDREAIREECLQE
jgi:hypothetical protein